MVEKVSQEENALRKWLPCRYIVAVLGSIGMAIVYGLKVNLSVAIVGMINHTAIATGEGHVALNVSAIPSSFDDDCAEAASNTSSTREDGPFIWDGAIQGITLSSYFWGYIVAQIPGARVSEVYSAKWVMFFSVAINVVCTLLIPMAARLHYGIMIVMRVGQGIGGGVTFPAMHVMLAHWAPPAERSVMSSIVYAGTALGTVISMLLSGLIVAELGWEFVFYLMGGLSVLWMLLWIWLVSDDPEKHLLIGEKERQYIVDALNVESAGSSAMEHYRVPWKSVFTSVPFWAILVAHTCSNWGWYMVLIELPLYMKTVLKFKIAENAVLTAMPFLCMWIFSMILSKLLDVLRGKSVISTTTARKVATLIASVVPAICFVLLCYIGCMRTLAVFLMTLAIMSVGGMFCGFLSNHIDIAPRFAGTLVAITNTVATVPGITVPVFVGKLTKADPSISSWRIIFWVTVVLYVVEILVYTLFGSGEEQKWNKASVEGLEIEPLRSPRAKPL